MIGKYELQMSICLHVFMLVSPGTLLAPCGKWLFLVCERPSINVLGLDGQMGELMKEGRERGGNNVGGCLESSSLLIPIFLINQQSCFLL